MAHPHDSCMEDAYGHHWGIRSYIHRKTCLTSTRLSELYFSKQFASISDRPVPAFVSFRIQLNCVAELACTSPSSSLLYR